MASQTNGRFTASLLLLGSAVTSRVLCASLMLALVLFMIVQRRRSTEIPVINSYDWDFMQRRAHAAYVRNAKGLIADGFAKYQGPFRIITTQESRVILPASFTEWAKNCKDLDHQDLVHHDFFADYPGFEGQAVVTNPDRLMIDVTRTKLSQNSQFIGIMNDQIVDVLKQTWTDQEDWHMIDWPQDTMNIISRMAAAVFVGPELGSDPVWQQLTTSYTVNLFMAVQALRLWPGFLRPLVHRFQPQSEVCRSQVQLARSMMLAEMQRREHARGMATAAGRPPAKHEDTITWMEEAASGRPLDHGAVQLAFAISALHTTSEAFRQVLLDLCRHQELIAPLRSEARNSITDNGWSLVGLSKMHLLDSVMKESQRLNSAIVGIERRVIRDTTMPNGMSLRRGSRIAVDSSDMWNPNVHENPKVFDGCRFLRMRERSAQGSSKAAFVSSYKEHNTFGAGKFICPGRFFVANEMKIALMHVLLKYDMRLQDGQEPKKELNGFYAITDQTVKVEVRRRF